MVVRIHFPAHAKLRRHRERLEKNLQWFVRNKVANGNMLETVQRVHKKLNIPGRQVVVLRSSDTRDLQTTFDAMSRTVNVKAVN